MAEPEVSLTEFLAVGRAIHKAIVTRTPLLHSLMALPLLLLAIFMILRGHRATIDEEIYESGYGLREGGSAVFAGMVMIGIGLFAGFLCVWSMVFGGLVGWCILGVCGTVFGGVIYMKPPKRRGRRWSAAEMPPDGVLKPSQIESLRPARAALYTGAVPAGSSPADVVRIAAALMMADGTQSAEEEALLRRLSERGGLTPEQLQAILDDVAGGEEIQVDVPLLQEDRSSLLRVAIQMAIADGVIERPEREMLEGIWRRLGDTSLKLDQLIASVRQRLKCSPEELP